MNALQYITYRRQTHAIIVRRAYKNKPIDFFTKEENPIQMGMFTREKGYVVQSHKHVCNSFEITSVQEFIFLKKGQVRVSFFSDLGKKYNEVILNTGDSVLTLFGGHSIDFLKKSTLLEIKQGPYSENKKVFY